MSDTALVVVFVLIIIFAAGCGAYGGRALWRKSRTEKEYSRQEKERFEAEEVERQRRQVRKANRSNTAQTEKVALGDVAPLTECDRQAIDDAFKHIETKGVPYENDTEAHWFPRGPGAWMTGEIAQIKQDLDIISVATRELWDTKEGDILDELVSNLPFAASPHPYVLLREICDRLWSLYGASHPTKSPLMLLSMLLYTQEPADIDRLLLYDAPVWVEGSLPGKETWSAYLTQNSTSEAKPLSITAQIDTMAQNILRTRMLASNEAALDDYRKWIKLTCLLSALTGPPNPPSNVNATLFKIGYNIPEEVISEFYNDDLQERVLGWMPPTACTFNHGRGPKDQSTGGLTIRIHDARYNLPLVPSQYPGEDAALLPPFSVFRLNNVRKEGRLGTLVDVTFTGTVQSHEDCSFNRRVLDECWAAESKLRRVDVLLETLIATRDVPHTLYVSGLGSADGCYSLNARKVRGMPLWCNKTFSVYTSGSSSRWVIGKAPDSGVGRMVSEQHGGAMPHLMKDWFRSAPSKSDYVWAKDQGVRVSAVPPPRETHKVVSFDALSDTSDAISLEMESEQTALLCEDRKASISPQGVDPPTLPYQPPFLEAQNMEMIQGTWRTMHSVQAIVSGHLVTFISPPLPDAYATLSTTPVITLSGASVMFCTLNRIEWSDGDVWTRPMLTNPLKQYRDVSPPPPVDFIDFV